MSELDQLTFSILNSLSDLTRMSEAPAGFELHTELDCLATEEVRVNIPVLSGLERTLVQRLNQTAMSKLCFGHDDAE